MEENLLAVVRIRPNGAAKAVWSKEESTVIGGSDGKETFNLDKVFDGKITNKSIFEESVVQLMDAVVQGYNVSVLGYGSSGSGKTHSLTGVPDGELGLVQEIFRNLMERFKKDSTNKYRIHMSCLEIYCEKLRDLLLERSPELQIMEKNGEPYIAGLSQMTISSLEDFDYHLKSATNRREVGSTTLNSVSSRSHYIIRLVIESTSTESTMEVKSRSSIVHIVDLAGSENASMAQTSGVRNLEGANINRSLLALTKCISLLSDMEKKKQPNIHVPYRDSKLTRVLKPCLGGNSKTLVICCISPDQLYESQSTLKFSRLVKNVKARPVKNEVSENGDLAMYVKQINDLRQQLKESEEKRADEDYKARCKTLEEMSSCLIAGDEKTVPTVRKPNRRHSWAPGALKAKPRRSLSPLKKKGRLEHIVENEDVDEEFTCDGLGNNTSFGLVGASYPSVSSTPRSSMKTDELFNQATIRPRESSSPPNDGNFPLEATPRDVLIQNDIGSSISDELRACLVNENERLKEELSTLKNKVHQSALNVHTMLVDQSIVDDLRSQLNNEETTITSFNTEVDHLSIRELSDRLQEKELALAAVAKELSYQCAVVSHLKNKNDDLQTGIEIKSQEIHVLTQKLIETSLSEENERLINEISMSKALINDLKSQLVSKDDEINSINFEMSRLNERLSQQAKWLEERKAMSDAGALELTAYRAEVTKLTTDKDDLEKKVYAKNQENDVLTAQLFEERQNTKKYSDGVTEQISMGKALLADLRAQLISANSEVSRLNFLLTEQTEKSTFTANNGELRLHRDDAARLKTENEDLRMKIELHKQEIVQLSAQLIDERNMIEKYSKDISTMNSELSSLSDENTQLNKDKDDLQKQIKAMLDESLTKVKVSEIIPDAQDRDNKELEDLQRTIVDLKSQLLCQEVSVEELQKQLLEREENIRSKSDSISRMKTELSDERQKIARSLDINRLRETRNNQIQLEVRGLQEEISKSTVEKRQLAILLEEEKKQKSHVESSFAKLSTELCAVKESVNQMVSVKEQCASTIDTQKKTIMKLEVELQMAKEDLSQAKASTCLESHVSCKIKIDSLNSELDLATSSAKEKEAELNELKEQIISSMQNISNLKLQVADMAADISVKEEKLKKANELIAEKNENEQRGRDYIRQKKTELAAVMKENTLLKQQLG